MTAEAEPKLTPSREPFAMARADAAEAEEMTLEARAARAAARGDKTTRVVAARIPLRLRVVELWRNRELFAFLVRKEVKVKYKNSFLGFLWSMLNPALTMAVFYVLFTFFLPNGIPNFVIYMFGALLVWNFFQTSVLGGTGVVVNNGGIVKKVAFPREILSLASVGSAAMFLLFQSVVMVLFMMAAWHAPAWGMLWLLVPALAAIFVFAAALAVFLSAVNVYMRDTQHLIEVLLTAWFWAIPAVYRFPGRVHDGLARHHLLWIYFLNPITPIVMTFQRVLYAQPTATSTLPGHPVIAVLPNYPTQWYLGACLAVVVVSAVFLVGAMYVFGRLEGNFAEEL